LFFIDIISADIIIIIIIKRTLKSEKKSVIYHPMT